MVTLYTCLFRRNGTDRQQLETFSLKFHFQSERMTAILRKTADSNVQPVVIPDPTGRNVKTYTHVEVKEWGEAIQ
uniref:Uncharacterized protein n=1 Tax=Romanomermis culicivorax TaxID=13658 RepID=A0A915HZH9_ROMCU